MASAYAFRSHKMVLNAPAFASQVEVQSEIQIIQKNFSKVTSLYYRDIFILRNLTGCGNQHKAIIWEQFMGDFPVIKDL